MFIIEQTIVHTRSKYFFTLKGYKSIFYGKGPLVWALFTHLHYEKNGRMFAVLFAGTLQRL